MNQQSIKESMQMVRWKLYRDGFTFLELMVVLGIISILAAIAIPKFVQYRYNTYDTTAASDIKNAYTSSQVYFIDHQEATITNDKLSETGYQQSDYINFSIIDGQYNSLKMRANHVNGKRIYLVNAQGSISYYSTPK